MSKTEGVKNSESARLDAIDMQMLRLLRDNGRLPIKTLAAQAHVSRASAYSRLARLEKLGVVRGFTVLVDPVRVGFSVCAVLLISTTRAPAEAGSLEMLKDTPGIEYAAWVTGEVDLILIVRAKNVDELRDSIVWKLRRNPAVRDTKTLLVFQEAIHEPYLLPDDLRPARAARAKSSKRR